MIETYIRKAVVVRVIDGDTIVLDVDLGFNTWNRGSSFRLYGINAAEHGTPAGDAATDNLTKLLPVGTQVTIMSIKADKFGGRYDAIIDLPNGKSLSQTLIDGQWAASWNGLGEKPLPPWPRTVTP